MSKLCLPSSFEASSVKDVHVENYWKILGNMKNKGYVSPMFFPNGYLALVSKTDGAINIFDYKTGKIPTLKQIKSGHALQLLIEGLIAKERTFNNIKSNKIDKLVYWQLGNSKLELDEEVDELLEKTEEYLKKLINIFDFETTPYHCRPTPKFIPKNRDYEHLARIKEWSVQEEGESNDE